MTIKSLYDFACPYKEKTDEIDITKIAQEFIATNDRRREHFNEFIMLLL